MFKSRNFRVVKFRRDEGDQAVVDGDVSFGKFRTIDDLGSTLDIVPPDRTGKGGDGSLDSEV